MYEERYLCPCCVPVPRLGYGGQTIIRSTVKDSLSHFLQLDQVGPAGLADAGAAWQVAGSVLDFAHWWDNLDGIGPPSLSPRGAFHVIVHVNHAWLSARDAVGWTRFVARAVSRAVAVGFKTPLHV